VTQRSSMQPHNDIVERSGSEQAAAHHARYAEVKRKAWGFTAQING